jgi:hypothetical protein
MNLWSRSTSDIVHFLSDITIMNKLRSTGTYTYSAWPRPRRSSIKANSGTAFWMMVFYSDSVRDSANYKNWSFIADDRKLIAVRLLFTMSRFRNLKWKSEKVSLLCEQYGWVGNNKIAFELYLSSVRSSLMWSFPTLYTFSLVALSILLSILSNES